jgi:hypothetical protein
MAVKRWGWIWILAAILQIYLPAIFFPKEEEPYGEPVASAALAPQSSRVAGTASTQLTCSCTHRHQASFPQPLGSAPQMCSWL